MILTFKPQCLDYQAITGLSAALALAARTVTSNDPPWMRERVWKG